MVMYWSFIVLFILGFLSFTIERNHLLLLLSLEYMVLSIFMGLFFFNLLMYEYYFSLIDLTFSVCEGVLGLCLLVQMIELMMMIIFKLLEFYDEDYSYNY